MGQETYNPETLSFPSTGGNLGRVRLVTVEHAKREIRNFCQRFIGHYNSGFRSSYNARTESRIGCFRSWNAYVRSRTIVDQEFAKALDDLEDLVLPQNKQPRGPQCISTRNWRGGTVGTRYYKGAYWFPPGRPALPASWWIRREKERRDRRKTGRPPGRPRSDGKASGSVVVLKLPFGRDSRRDARGKVKKCRTVWKRKANGVIERDADGNRVKVTKCRWVNKRPHRAGNPPLKLGRPRKWRYVFRISSAVAAALRRKRASNIRPPPTKHRRPGVALFLSRSRCK